MLRAIDLFAGGGGLTAGLRRAGFHVAAAVEKHPHACSTYRANHRNVAMLESDVCDVSDIDIAGKIGAGRVDLLAGCPPCQGFTSLTAKYRRTDPRNRLLLEMARLAEELRPRAVMVENVPGLATKGRDLYDQFRLQLRNLGYVVSEDVLQAADFGVPQRRKRLVLLAGLQKEIPLPTPTHSEHGEGGLKRWRTVRDAIGRMPEPVTLAQARSRGPVEKSDWHVVRSLSAQSKARIAVVKSGASRVDIPEDMRPACHRNGYKGFTNVYGRMEWDAPAPTVTGGCTTFSKGRFGHPDDDRTISVREAALLQTFPRDYVFDTPYIGHVCDIIGNALPCEFAAAVSRSVSAALNR